LNQLPLRGLGRDVSRLVLGTMLLTDSGADVLDEYVRLGGNAIDTARVYGDGDAERALGAWLEARPGARERLIIVSKARTRAATASASPLRRSSATCA
jgi:aryl-alcohol dehydrogenase-like predicted oxidoreductase